MDAVIGDTAVETAIATAGIAEAVAAETQSDAAVAIAQIEADRDVAVAEIAAEIASETMEAHAADDEDITWLRGELGSLRERQDNLLEQIMQHRQTTEAMLSQMISAMERMTGLLTPPPPSETVTEAVPMTAPDAPEDGPKESPEAASQDGPAPPKLTRKWLR